jgi:activator of 2-hydroxyglutaryl-CoA dehydratase
MRLDGLAVMQVPVGSRAICNEDERRYRLDSGITGAEIEQRKVKIYLDNLDKQLKYFVGIDWGSQNHRVVVLNHDGRMIERHDAAHSGKGLQNLVDRLRKTCPGPPIQTGSRLKFSGAPLLRHSRKPGVQYFL